jgi:hypothetical protein
MTVKRSTIALLLVAALLTLALPTAHAKGPSDRIIITGPGLGDEGLILTDRDVTELLSMAGLEHFEIGAIPEPAGLGEGYTLERQYQTAPGQYQSFDRVVYYPDPNGDLGYVFYEGIFNGSTEYDDQWFRARPIGDATIRMLLDGTLPQTYLALTNDTGELHILDPLTLDEIAAVRITEEPGRLAHMQAQANAAGTRLFFRPETLDNPAQYDFDLADQTVCRSDDEFEFWHETLDGRVFSRTRGTYQLDVYNPRWVGAETTSIDLSDEMKITFSASPIYIFGYARSSEGLALMSVFLMSNEPYVENLQYETSAFLDDPGQIPTTWDLSGSAGTFYITDGLKVVGFQFLDQRVIEESALEYDGRAAVETGITQAVPLAAFGWQLYLYLNGEAAGTPASEVPPGIFVIDARAGQQVAHWHADLHITESAHSRAHLYLLHTPEGTETVELLQLDIATGEILHTQTLPQDVWAAEVVRLNPALVQALGTANTALPCP